MSTTDRLRENVTVSSNVINRAAETVDVNHGEKTNSQANVVIVGGGNCGLALAIPDTSRGLLGNPLYPTSRHRDATG